VSAVSFTLTGTENLKKIFAEFPENGYRKPINAAFVKAAVPVKNAMISNLPPNLSAIKRAIKAKSSRASKGEPSLAVGVFSSGGKVFRNSRGIDWNPWTIALWHNYGTLSNRTALARLHVYATPRKKKTADWDGGIKPKFFIERGWDSSKTEAQKVFEKVSDEEIIKFFQKNAAK
jgi:hypothetical protein